ncbi:histidine phosphatase family protein [Pelagibacterium halotolerans]|uniref:histidine phosphatase family protein n=1 Tax=Pelagibacterium halotolerans TaxID=531813 RepID=UPI00384B4397
MSTLLFVSHPEVTVDSNMPVEQWQLSAVGVERMRAFSRSSIPSKVRAIWSSTETKAIEAAGILGGALGLGIRVSKDLGENDRSATGFLPPAEFEAVADAFFASPATSVRGWERAIDAQTRVREAVTRIVSEHTDGDLAIVAHGAVGTLMYCALSGNAIARSFDQPFQGHYWAASFSDLVPRHGWIPIAPRPRPSRPASRAPQGEGY